MTDEKNWRDATETRRFMWSVQALAAPASEQEAAFPGFVDVPDELALEHEETQAGFLQVAGPSISEEQRQTIQDLDRLLEAMSDPENGRLWKLEALRQADEWKRVRVLAAIVLDAMGWAKVRPPRDRSIYVGPPEE